MLLALDEVGGADVARLHALDDGVALERGADAVADERPAAVAADQIAAGERPRLAGLEVARGDPDELALLAHLLDARAV